MIPNIRFFRYLELADWDVEEAVRSAQEDHEWEKDVEVVKPTKNKDIRITVKLQDGIPVDFAATGAGLVQPQGNNDDKKKNKKLTVFDGVPAIATKSVRPQDVYNVRTAVLFLCIGYIYYTYSSLTKTGCFSTRRFWS